MECFVRQNDGFLKVTQTEAMSLLTTTQVVIYTRNELGEWSWVRRSDPTEWNATQKYEAMRKEAR